MRRPLRRVITGTVTAATFQHILCTIPCAYQIRLFIGRFGGLASRDILGNNGLIVIVVYGGLHRALHNEGGDADAQFRQKQQENDGEKDAQKAGAFARCSATAEKSRKKNQTSNCGGNVKNCLQRSKRASGLIISAGIFDHFRNVVLKRLVEYQSQRCRQNCNADDTDQDVDKYHGIFDEIIAAPLNHFRNKYSRVIFEYRSNSQN